MKTPASLVAEKIVDRLIQDELLDVKSRGKFVEKLATGGVRAEDWRFALEAAIVRVRNP